MKVFSRLLGVLLIVGMVMVIASFFMGSSLAEITGFFNDEESYSEVMTQDVTDPIDTLMIDVQTRHLIFHDSDDDQMHITYRVHETKDEWTFSDDVLGTYEIIQEEKQPLWNWFNFSFVADEYREVHVYIPHDWILTLQLKSSVGDIELIYGVEKSYETLDVSTDTGSIKLQNIQANSLQADLDTGDASLVNLNIQGDIMVTNSTGDIVLNNVVGQETELRTSTGKITLETFNLTSLDADVSTGRIILDEGTIDGGCVLHSDTGNITITLVDATHFDIDSSTGDVTVNVLDLSLYRLDLETDTGTIRIDGLSQGSEHQTSTGTIAFTVSVNTGNITINVQD
jgi:DUF4097 and DUF4098 domain-containing protein YvlB